METGRYLLNRRNSSGVHEPVGRFETAQAAKDHANEDGMMRGIVKAPYQWGASFDGTWISYCPDWTEPREGVRRCDDYIVIDSQWQPSTPPDYAVFPLDDLPPMDAAPHYAIYPGKPPTANE